MGKEANLFYGTLMFVAFWAVIAVVVGGYVFSSTKDRMQANSNMK
jgi:hypothetical protein